MATKKNRQLISGFLNDKNCKCLAVWWITICYGHPAWVFIFFAGMFLPLVMVMEFFQFFVVGPDLFYMDFCSLFILYFWSTCLVYISIIKNESIVFPTCSFSATTCSYNNTNWQQSNGCDQQQSFPSFRPQIHSKSKDDDIGECLLHPENTYQFIFKPTIIPFTETLFIFYPKYCSIAAFNGMGNWNILMFMMKLGFSVIYGIGI